MAESSRCQEGAIGHESVNGLCHGHPFVLSAHATCCRVSTRGSRPGRAIRSVGRDLPEGSPSDRLRMTWSVLRSAYSFAMTANHGQRITHHVSRFCPYQHRLPPRRPGELMLPEGHRSQRSAGGCCRPDAAAALRPAPTGWASGSACSTSASHPPARGMPPGDPLPARRCHGCRC